MIGEKTSANAICTRAGNSVAHGDDAALDAFDRHLKAALNNREFVTIRYHKYNGPEQSSHNSNITLTRG